MKVPTMALTGVDESRVGVWVTTAAVAAQARLQHQCGHQA